MPINNGPYALFPNWNPRTIPSQQLSQLKEQMNLQDVFASAPHPEFLVKSASRGHPPHSPTTPSPNTTTKKKKKNERAILSRKHTQISHKRGTRNQQ